MAKEAAELAAGTLDPDCARMVDLFPDGLLSAADTVLAAPDLITRRDRSE
ncbi:hypothetical protein OG930_13840 [Streptomyces sp. NBC_01799]|nr:hypothetical protein OG930_13840 [Streptomyces sp. NBC_01799]